MKISLPLKLGIFVVVVFGLLICGMLLWKPVKIRYYTGKLHSSNPKERVAAVEVLLAMGKRGREALVRNFDDGEAAADFLIAHWTKANEAVAQDEYGHYPLHPAAEKGYLTVAVLLIAKGAVVNAKRKDGVTPLHLAAEYGQKAVAELLIAKGAEVNAKERYRSWTPLHKAAGSGYKTVAVLLIAKGAVVDAKDDWGETPLHLAANKAVAELLVAKGAEVNAKNNNGRTPLHCAAVIRPKTLAELLIANSADVNIKDKFGETPLHLAAQWGSKSVAELLIAKGAEVNVRGGLFSSTPLHLAARWGQKAVAELLIVKGAEVNSKDEWGRTPLDRVIKKGENEVAALIRAHGGVRGKE